MSFTRRDRSARRRGFTLLESMVALAIFAVVGYALAVVATVGARSERTVVNTASASRTLRGSTMPLIDELRAAQDASISIAIENDGNYRLRFMQPIDVAGAATWGVCDRTLGADPASQNQAGWQIQYTARDVVDSSGATVKQLVRQVLDDALKVRRERIVAERLRSSVASPGFTMIKSGDMWELTLCTVDPDDGRNAMRTVFHVQPRN